MHQQDNDNRHEREPLQPVSMYAIAAKLFAHVAKTVADRFGEEGKQAVMEGVRAFGLERGQDIARRAKAIGQDNSLGNYLSNYDMERSDHFEYENVFEEDMIEQHFTRCIFADQWEKDGMQEYGMLYCKMIDPAIAEGFNPQMEVVHDKHFFTDGCCHFCFRVNKDAPSEAEQK
ncbi:MAG: L-2-amino-thiazoline-4-carboxylic acid hydrolase [Christensenellales bacterium]|jgi:hypothetical protein